MSVLPTEGAITPAQRVEGLTPTDWDQVHAVVQEALGQLAEDVQRLRPDVTSVAGRNEGRVWFLYSYRTFEVPADHAVDPVVVGVAFEPGANGHAIGVQGDIVGEASGRIHFEVEKREVPASSAAVRAAAGEIATQLGKQAEVVGVALTQPGPPEDW